MEKVFNDHNCKISSILKSVNLEHLHPKFIRKCVTLDTFLNLTEEDLDYLEITDSTERKTILDNFHLYQQQFSDILTPAKFNRTKMLQTSLQQLNAINSLVSTLLNQLTRQTATKSCLNRLVDDVTPVSSIVQLLTSQSLDSLHLIEQDIDRQIALNEGSAVPRWQCSWARTCGSVMLMTSATLCIPLVSILIWVQFRSVFR